MRYLLDTHVFLWGLAKPILLSSAARSVMDDRRHELLWSTVSTAELAVKLSIGKLKLPTPLARFLESRLRQQDLVVLPLQQAHAVELAELPLLHRDPFDRLLVAQARIEGVPIITADRLIAKYDVEVCW